MKKEIDIHIINGHTFIRKGEDETFIDIMPNGDVLFHKKGEKGFRILLDKGEW